MAVRVQVAERGGTRYVAVLEDDYSAGQRKIKTLASFGEATPANRLRAEQFKANYIAARELRGQARENDEAKQAFIALFGLILGIAVVAALLSEE